MKFTKIGITAIAALSIAATMTGCGGAAGKGNDIKDMQTLWVATDNPDMLVEFKEDGGLLYARSTDLLEVSKKSASFSGTELDVEADEDEIVLSLKDEELFTLEPANKQDADSFRGLYDIETGDDSMENIFEDCQLYISKNDTFLVKDIDVEYDEDEGIVELEIFDDDLTAKVEIEDGILYLYKIDKDGEVNDDKDDAKAFFKVK